MLCFGLQETTLSCGSALYRSQSPGKSECVFTVKRSPSWYSRALPQLAHSSQAKTAQFTRPQQTGVSSKNPHKASQICQPTPQPQAPTQNPREDKKLPWPGSRPPAIATADHRDRRSLQPPIIATAGHCNRRPPQPQPGQLALHQRHSAFGAPPAKTQAKTSLKASLELGWV